MTNAADYTRRPREHLARLGLTLATRDEIVQGRDIASRTVGPTVATVETLQAVQDRTRCAAFAYHGVDGALAGVLCIIPLTRAAAPSLAAGVLDGISPPLEIAARPHDPVIAVYGWGMAGVTWRGRAVVMAAALAIHREIYDTVPLYGRAATPGGERTLLGRLGARPAPGPGGLVVCPAWTAQRKVA
ncbi:MAG: hypothetical protein KA085_00690 [Phenylobacterium sp.]|uniref:hypothetical protein n=1 Tax=Phenylobacterium sp. TaxID=1871053 RepID=UPI001B51A28A|nr:hypothetical protein [Phenylobacterium sp.]MBP7814612.1 hypothetical protein [Phenylobacterium sp.]MBP9754143.1 hypothetical protein [Phenylobacterium sp.]